MQILTYRSGASCLEPSSWQVWSPLAFSSRCGLRPLALWLLILRGWNQMSEWCHSRNWHLPHRHHLFCFRPPHPAHLIWLGVLDQWPPTSFTPQQQNPSTPLAVYYRIVLGQILLLFRVHRLYLQFPLHAEWLLKSSELSLSAPLVSVLQLRLSVVFLSTPVSWQLVLDL